MSYLPAGGQAGWTVPERSERNIRVLRRTLPSISRRGGNRLFRARTRQGRQATSMLHAPDPSGDQFRLAIVWLNLSRKAPHWPLAYPTLTLRLMPIV